MLHVGPQGRDEYALPIRTSVSEKFSIPPALLLATEHILVACNRYSSHYDAMLWPDHTMYQVDDNSFMLRGHATVTQHTLLHRPGADLPFVPAGSGRS